MPFALFQGLSETDRKQREMKEIIIDWVAARYLPFSFFDDEATKGALRSIHKDARMTNFEENGIVSFQQYVERNNKTTAKQQI